MTIRQASCSCGKLTVTTEGEPVRVSICHCPACQRRTGSVFDVQARFPSDRVTIAGASKVYVRTADSGNQIEFHFCPDCGATVYYRYGDIPDVVAVPVGGFADAAFPPPRVSVYESTRHPWAALPKDIEHLD
jgi:hypothetical protein